MTVAIDREYSHEHVPDPPMPEWWERAACRSDGRDAWIIERGDSLKLTALRAICRACPAAGECLADAVTLPLYLRKNGPVRCGVTGKGWQAVEHLVRDLAPATAGDWDALAAWMLDGDADELLGA